MEISDSDNVFDFYAFHFINLKKVLYFLEIFHGQCFHYYSQFRNHTLIWLSVPFCINADEIWMRWSDNELKEGVDIKQKDGKQYILKRTTEMASTTFFSDIDWFSWKYIEPRIDVKGIRFNKRWLCITNNFNII